MITFDAEAKVSSRGNGEAQVQRFAEVDVRTRFLLQARHCYSIDPERISQAGGRLLCVGRVEDDGTMTVDVDVEKDDRDCGRRLGNMFASISAPQHPQHT